MDGNRAQFANNLQELHGNFSEWRGTGAVSINHLRKKYSAPCRGTDFHATETLRHVTLWEKE